MSEQKIPIPAMLYNAAVGGHVTNSQQIIDENLNREQNDINQETVGAVPYNNTTPNGMGRIVLKKNDNFKEVIEAQTNGNTIFVIKYDFTLTDDVTIPANCILQFEGGSISGDVTLITNNTKVINYTINCVNSVLIPNGLIPLELNKNPSSIIQYTLECFGDYRIANNRAQILTYALNNASNRVIFINENIYVVTPDNYTISCNNTTITSLNKSCITFTKNVLFTSCFKTEISNLKIAFDVSVQIYQLYIKTSSFVTIKDCEIFGTKIGGVPYGGGIHVFDSCEYIFIKNNFIHDVFGDAILVHNNCRKVQIHGNMIDTSSNIGIEIEGRVGNLGSSTLAACTNISIIGNQIYNCSDTGIHVNFSTNIIISSNRVSSKIGINVISCLNVSICANNVASSESCLLIWQEYFGDITLTPNNINVVGNFLTGSIGTNLSGKDRVINAMVHIQNAKDIIISNNNIVLYDINTGVRTYDYDNDAIVAILSSTSIKITNNNIQGIWHSGVHNNKLTGVLLGRSYKVQQIATSPYYEITTTLQQIPNDIKIKNNSLYYLKYGISTIIPNSSETVPYTDGVENKATKLYISDNVINAANNSINIGNYCDIWDVYNNLFEYCNTDNYVDRGLVSKRPSAMTGCLEGHSFYNKSTNIFNYWTGSAWVDATGTPV